MNKTPPSHESPIQPQSTTSEKPPIRVAQEEFLDDQANASIDKSEYEETGRHGTPDTAREKEGERPTK